MAVRKKPLAKSARAQSRPWLLGDPEFEAIKALRENYPPHRAVMLCDFLSKQSRRMTSGMAKTAPDVRTILRALRDKRIPFVLTGTHGISAWTGHTRATHDIDILVKPGRNHERAVKLIQELYPGLECRRFTATTAFFVPGETVSVIDVSCPFRRDNEETLRLAIWVEEEGLRYRIPKLETALANKYGAMLAITRDAGKRTQDAVDFYNMVRHAYDPGRDGIELRLLSELGELVWPSGGGAEILRFVDMSKNGMVPPITPSRPTNGQ